MSDYIEDYDYGITDSEKFMENYRYNIVNIVQVEKAFPWLRHRRVINAEDEELIINGYRTNVLKTGHMVDMLMARGKKAFDALLEHIEYDYPEHFKIFTGKEPRSPSSEYTNPKKSKYRTSTMILYDQLVNVQQQIMQSMMKEKESKRLMDETLTKLQSQIETFQKETDMKDQQISELSQRNLEIREQYKYMQTHWDHDRQEKNQYAEECERLRKAKDEAQDKCNKILHDQGSAARASIKQNSVRDQARNKLQQENTQLRQELERYKNNTPVQNNDTTNDAIKRQKVTIEKLIEERDKLKHEKEELQEQIQGHADMTAMYESNNNEYKCQLELIKQERDGILKQFNECRESCVELQKENTILKEKVANVSSELRTMENEAASYHRDRTYPLNSPRCTGIVRPSRGEDLYQTIPPDPDEEPIPTADYSDEEDPRPAPPVGPRIPTHQQSQQTMSRRDAILRIPSSDRETGATNARHRKGKKKAPLALYAPKEIIDDLERELLDTDAFQQCPYEKLLDSRILATWLEGGSCVHYKQVGSEYFLCIATETLRDHMQRDDYGRILLCVPPEVLVRMRNQSITPIVIVVKYKDLEDRGKKSREEEELDRLHRDFQYAPDKLIVNRGEDLPSIVNKIKIKCAKYDSSQRPCASRSISTTSI